MPVKPSVAYGAALAASQGKDEEERLRQAQLAEAIVKAEEKPSPKTPSADTLEKPKPWWSNLWR